MTSSPLDFELVYFVPNDAIVFVIVICFIPCPLSINLSSHRGKSSVNWMICICHTWTLTRCLQKTNCGKEKHAVAGEGRTGDKYK